MKVLLVEDDKKLSIAVGMRIKSFGHNCTFAQDAITAVSQAVEHKPDLIIIDINLPGGDGFLVAERLRSLANGSQAEIIFITASKKPGLRQRANEAGASAFLEKPFDSARLLDAIETTQATGSMSWEIPQ